VTISDGENLLVSLVPRRQRLEELGELLRGGVIEQERDAFAFGDAAIDLPGENGDEEEVGERWSAEDAA